MATPEKNLVQHLPVEAGLIFKGFDVKEDDEATIGHLMQIFNALPSKYHLHGLIYPVGTKRDIAIVQFNNAKDMKEIRKETGLKFEKIKVIKTFTVYFTKIDPVVANLLSHLPSIQCEEYDVKYFDDEHCYVSESQESIEKVKENITTDLQRWLTDLKSSKVRSPSSAASDSDGSSESSFVVLEKEGESSSTLNQTERDVIACSVLVTVKENKECNINDEISKCLKSFGSSTTSVTKEGAIVVFDDETDVHKFIKRTKSDQLIECSKLQIPLVDRGEYVKFKELFPDITKYFQQKWNKHIVTLAENKFIIYCKFEEILDDVSEEFKRQLKGKYKSIEPSQQVIERKPITSQVDPDTLVKEEHDKETSATLGDQQENANGKSSSKVNEENDKKDTPTEPEKKERISKDEIDNGGHTHQGKEGNDKKDTSTEPEKKERISKDQIDNGGHTHQGKEGNDKKDTSTEPEKKERISKDQIDNGGHTHQGKEENGKKDTPTEPEKKERISKDQIDNGGHTYKGKEKNDKKDTPTEPEKKERISKDQIDNRGHTHQGKEKNDKKDTPTEPEKKERISKDQIDNGGHTHQGKEGNDKKYTPTEPEKKEKISKDQIDNGGHTYKGKEENDKKYTPTEPEKKERISKDQIDNGGHTYKGKEGNDKKDTPTEPEKKERISKDQIDNGGHTYKEKEENDKKYTHTEPESNNVTSDQAKKRKISGSKDDKESECGTNKMDVKDDQREQVKKIKTDDDEDDDLYGNGDNSSDTDGGDDKEEGGKMQTTCQEKKERTPKDQMDNEGHTHQGKGKCLQDTRDDKENKPSSSDDNHFQQFISKGKGMKGGKKGGQSDNTDQSTPGQVKDGKKPDDLPGHKIQNQNIDKSSVNYSKESDANADTKSQKGDQRKLDGKQQKDSDASLQNQKKDSSKKKQDVDRSGYLTVQSEIFKFIKYAYEKELRAIEKNHKVTIIWLHDRSEQNLGIVSRDRNEETRILGETKFIDLYQRVHNSVQYQKVDVVDKTQRDIKKALKNTRKANKNIFLLHDDNNVVFVGKENDVKQAKKIFKQELGIPVEERHLKIVSDQAGLSESSSDQLPSEITVGTGIKIVIKRGDITEEQVDVIVNAANGRLRHGGGVARAIAMKAGEGINKEGQYKLNRFKDHQLGVAELLHTGGYNLKAKYVIHAVGPTSEIKYETFQSLLERTFLNCLAYADSNLEAASISIPLISSGNFGGNKQQCAKALADSLKEFIKVDKARCLKEIRLVNIDSEATQEILIQINAVNWFTTNSEISDVAGESASEKKPIKPQNARIHLSNAVVVEGFRKYDSHGETKYQLAMILNKPENGGGQIEHVIYPIKMTRNKAIVIFVEQKVARSLISNGTTSSESEVNLRISSFKVDHQKEAIILDVRPILPIIPEILDKLPMKYYKVGEMKLLFLDNQDTTKKPETYVNGELEKWLNNQLKEKEQFSLSNCVIVTEFVKYSSHGETSDKLQITLQKRKLGGGDVHKVIYPFGNSEDKALAIFDESEVASSLIKAKMILKISPFKIRPPDKAFTLEFGKVAHLLDPTLSSKIFKTLKVNGEYLDDGQLVLYNKADGDKVIEYVTEQLEQSLASSVDQATTTTTSSNIGVKEVAGISNESTTEFSGILDVTNINAEKVLEASQETSRKYNVLISPKEIVVVGNKENVDNAMTYFQRLCWVSQLTKHGELNISRPRGDDGMILSDVKFVLPGGITVTVRQGDITEENVDVIVNAANGQLQHGSGVARAIADKAGRRIHEEGQWKLKRRQGPLNVTEVLHTAGYNLNGTYVIHAVGPRRNEYKNKDEFVQCLERTFLNCLEYADAELEARSIAIPLISSGIFGGNKAECAQSLLNSILRIVKNGKHRASTIKEIHLVNIDVEATSEIQDVFNKWQQSGKKTEVEECPICLDVLTEPVKKLQCGHRFCSNCIDDELKHRKVCPMCRGNVKVLKGNQTPAKKDEVEECPICFDVLTETVKKQLQCGHKFCRNCIDRALQHRNACPICGIILGVLKGNQPPGRMTVNYSPMKLPGYPRCGSIAIVYNIPTGIQTREHPNPGLYYQGTGRTAYLPDNQEGRHVAGLLQKAFDARLIFTIGTSITSGTQNAVIWNDIHHKTSISGEPYGYPDPTYLSRVREELAAKGIK